MSSSARGVGFEVGVGPSVVLIDEGKAKTATTNTMKDDIYALRLQPGTDGGPWHPGQQDHEDHAEVAGHDDSSVAVQAR